MLAPFSIIMAKETLKLMRKIYDEFDELVTENKSLQEKNDKLLDALQKCYDDI